MASSKSIALYWGIRRYLNECQRRGSKPKTLRWYEQKLTMFRVYMAQQYRIASAGLVRYMHVQAFLVALQDEASMKALSAGKQGVVTDATVKGYSQVLTAFFVWCEYRGYIRFNPTKASSDIRQVYPKLRGASSRRDFLRGGHSNYSR